VSSPPQPIYHLARASELRAGRASVTYSPERLTEDGFVHCAGTADVALAVANDYFRDLIEPLYLLVIDPARLDAEVRFEAPAPIAGGATAHLALATRFPHVYGPINRDAVVEAAQLESGAAGYLWPKRFEPLDRVVAHL
jgi:uncharacterized protein (DUF952 family)